IRGRSPRSCRPPAASPRAAPSTPRRRSRDTVRPTAPCSPCAASRAATPGAATATTRSRYWKARMENKPDGRVLLALVLAVATIILWQVFLARKPKTPPPRESAPVTEVAPKQGTSLPAGLAGGTSAPSSQAASGHLPDEVSYPIGDSAFQAQIS